MQISGEQLIIGLSVATLILTLIILYNALFIVVDVRRIVRRVEGVTEQLEDMVMKPLSMIDGILLWVTQQIEGQTKAPKKKPKKK